MRVFPFFFFSLARPSRPLRPLTRTPCPLRRLLLNLFLTEPKARSPDPRAALPKAQVRT